MVKFVRHRIQVVFNRANDMEDNEKKGNPVDRIATSAWEYLAMKIDELKLRGVEGLSLFFGRFIVYSVIFLFFVVFLQFLAFAAAYRLGEITGSVPLGFTIMAAVMLVLVLVFYFMRRRLFVNSLVKFFIDLFFKE